MNRIDLRCQVCGVTCDIEGYDPAPSELLIGAFSAAHSHTPADWVEYRKQDHELYGFRGDDDADTDRS